MDFISKNTSPIIQKFQSPGIVAIFGSDISIWMVLLTVLITAVVYDQCMFVPISPSDQSQS